MDGAAPVNILKPGGCKTFVDYTANVFFPHIEKEQNKAERVDIVWDQYFDNNLKAKTTEKRAVGPIKLRRVEVCNPIPEPSSESLQQASFTFVQGALTN